MHFSLPLIVAAASLSTAAPLANTENIVLDKRADVGGVIAFQSGQWMSVVEIQKGINQWCSQMNGQVVPYSKSLNAQISGLITTGGAPGVLAGKYPTHYTNDKIRSGWTINEDECNTWMRAVVDQTTEHFKDRTNSLGGYGMVGDFGSVWVDPNAA